MVKTKRGLVLTTGFLSGLAVVLSFVSLGTEQWVKAQGRFTLPGSENDPLSSVKYGLFAGTLMEYYAGQYTYQLKATCSVGKNKCAYLCESSSESRKDQLNQLIAGEDVQFNTKCPQVLRSNYGPPIEKNTGKFRADEEERQFLNAGLYISTTFFLAISIVFGVISTVLSVWNTAANPVEVFLSIYGLYIYNSIACAGCMLALVLWGALFGMTIVDNVGILYTIRGQMTSFGLAHLGFSYWLLLPSCLLYSTSIAVLYVRQYLIQQEPEIKIHATTGEQDVGEIMIY